jgi:hypothetical protein
MITGGRFCRWFFFLSVFFHSYSWAVTYGSETAVSVLPAVTFPAADSDNMMLGFGFFRNGFTLQDSTTTCTFKSEFPVSGTIALNGGTLYLQQDFVLSDTNMIIGGGLIIGNGFTVKLSPSTSFETATTYTFQDTVLELSTDLELSSTFVFVGTSYLCGNDFPLWLEEPWDGLGQGALVAAACSWLYIGDIYLQNITGTNIACADVSGNITLRDTRWRQSGNFTFAQGSLNFYHSVEMMGSYTFAYQSGQVSTVLYESSLILDDSFTFSYDPKVMASRELLAFEDSTSELILQGATLYATTTGLRLTTGRLIVGETSGLYAESAVEAQSISFANTFTIQVLPAATLKYLNGLIVSE